MGLSQLDIFSAPDISYHTAIRALLRLDPGGAEEALDAYRRLYPGGRSLALEEAAIRFLQDPRVQASLDSEPEEALALWEEWIAQWPVPGHELLERLRRAYFGEVAQRLLEDLGSFPARPFSEFHLDGRGARCLLWGAQAKAAAEHLRKAIPDSPVPGRLYGCLGDALYRQGLSGAARSAYFRALFEGPDQVDLENLSDPEVKNLLSEPARALDPDTPPQGVRDKDPAWALPIGLLSQILPVPRVTGRDEAHVWWVEVQEGARPGRKERARGFAAGIILSELGLQGLGAFGVDLIRVRQCMKAIEPSLFAYYMKSRMNGDA